MSLAYIEFRNPNRDQSNFKSVGLYNTVICCESLLLICLVIVINIIKM